MRQRTKVKKMGKKKNREATLNKIIKKEKLEHNVKNGKRTRKK